MWLGASRKKEQNLWDLLGQQTLASKLWKALANYVDTYVNIQTETMESEAEFG